MKQIKYYRTGELREEIYHTIRVRNENDLPCLIKYHRNGAIKRQLWVNENGYPHRENGYADIRYDKNQKIYKQFKWLNGDLIESSYL